LEATYIGNYIVQYGTVQYGTSTVRYKYSTVQVQYGTSTVWYKYSMVQVQYGTSTVRYSTVQFTKVTTHYILNILGQLIGTINWKPLI
jgi:hypothetical protein